MARKLPYAAHGQKDATYTPLRPNQKEKTPSRLSVYGRQRIWLRLKRAEGGGPTHRVAAVWAMQKTIHTCTPRLRGAEAGWLRGGPDVLGGVFSEGGFREEG